MFFGETLGLGGAFRVSVDQRLQAFFLELRELARNSLLWRLVPVSYTHLDVYKRQIEAQLKKGFEIGPQTPLAGEVAKMFCEMTGNERMTFCNTGSEAVMAAMRVARTVTGRKKVALFANAYHGMFDEVLVKGFKRGGVPHSSPVAPGIPPVSYTHLCSQIGRAHV